MNSWRRITPNQTVSLFPFLAVLICTMGALLVLLVVMARQARVRAAAETDQERHERVTESNRTHQGPPARQNRDARSGDQPTPNDPVSEDPTTELADLASRAETLDAIHREGQSRLQTAQLQLGHIEDQIRRLHDQWAAIHQTAITLQELDKTYLADREKAEKELKHLRDLLRQSQSEVAEARLEAARKTTSYAIIPYQGANGTHRRPIYIECRKSSVVLLPEGIELKPSDFLGPSGPGNPLAAALRAAHAYHANQADDPTVPEQQPYPLLLVRPEGIPAYYQAREAIASWNNDFGYELIDGDWPLELPPANPELAELEYRAVEAARFRQRQLALAAPRRFGFGFQHPTDNSVDSGPGLDTVSTSQGNAVHAPSGTAAKREADVSSHAIPGTVPGGGSPGSPHLGSGGPSGGMVPGSATEADGDAIDGMSNVGTSDAPATDRGQDRAADRATGKSTPGGPRGLDPGSVEGAAEFGAPGPAHPDPQNGQARLGVASNKQPRDAVPIRRAIHVRVHSSQLAILPEQGTDGGHVVPIDGSIDDALNALGSALQDRMRRWGIAGRGLFWKPVLVLKPSPDAMDHAERLAQRLQRSGVEVQISSSLHQ